MSVLRHCQKSGASKSAGVGTPISCPAVHRGILTELLWPSPTDWSLRLLKSHLSTRLRLRMTHTLGVISLVSVYDPTGASEMSMKEAFYAQLQMVVDSSFKGDTSIVLDDFHPTTGTQKDGYESCVGPDGSVSRDAKIRRLRTAGSWFQRPDFHHWTWYSRPVVQGKRSTCRRRRSLDTCPELQGGSEHLVCRDRPQTSRRYPENTAHVSQDVAI